MPGSIDEIQARWAAKGYAIRPGSSPEALAAFEAKYGVRLPRAFRDFHAAFDPSGPNDGMIDFWPLSEIQPIAEYDGEDPAESPELVGWFYLADYLVCSHFYAIRLTTDPSDGGLVVSFDGEMIPQASSFAVFLKRYLADRENLKLHMPPPDQRWVADHDQGSSS